MQIELTYNKILVPIDFSDTSRKAFYVALKYAAAFDADTILLHVHDVGRSVDEMEKSASELERLEEGITRRLNELWAGGGLEEVDRRRVTLEIRGGKPWIEIVKTADELGCDLIVMGTQGLTGLKQMLIGSQAERVVRQATCHVLAIKPDGFEHSLDSVPKKFKV
jgi:nucleotide-binding universal stress UspA family protein